MFQNPGTEQKQYPVSCISEVLLSTKPTITHIRLSRGDRFQFPPYDPERDKAVKKMKWTILLAYWLRL